MTRTGSSNVTSQPDGLLVRLLLRPVLLAVPIKDVFEPPSNQLAVHVLIAVLQTELTSSLSGPFVIVRYH